MEEDYSKSKVEQLIFSRKRQVNSENIDWQLVSAPITTGLNKIRTQPLEQPPFRHPIVPKLYIPIEHKEQAI